MTAAQLLDACEEIVDGELGVLACHCPYCQGYLEAMPVAGRVDLGYLRNNRFDAVLSLPADGLTVARADDGGTMALSAAGQCWTFSVAE
jgi:hypothetical protein